METTITNTLQVFTNEELNANIRMVEIDGQPFFVAKDVCEALELKDVSMSVVRLDEDELTQVKLVSGGQMREMKAVNEYGLYNLILSSRKRTQKGRLFIYETLKKAGILPLIECEDKAA